MTPDNEIDPVSETESVQRYRATPLRPAVWMTSVLVWAMIVGLVLRVPTWASFFLSVVTGVSFLFYLVSYIYLMANDREALRAERGGKRTRTSRLRSSERSASGKQTQLDDTGYRGMEGPGSLPPMTHQETQKQSN